MNKNILTVCPENGAYKYRPETDVLFRLPDGAFKYSGIIDSTIRFIQNVQLKRTDVWKAFVEQFRTAPDSDRLTWKGEFWGKMMRGACFTYQYTKDEQSFMKSFAIPFATSLQLRTPSAEYAHIPLKQSLTAGIYGVESTYFQASSISLTSAVMTPFAAKLSKP